MCIKNLFDGRNIGCPYATTSSVLNATHENRGVPQTKCILIAAKLHSTSTIAWLKETHKRRGVPQATLDFFETLFDSKTQTA
jgi:hypothetical protein